MSSSRAGGEFRAVCFKCFECGSWGKKFPDLGKAVNNLQRESPVSSPLSFDDHTSSVGGSLWPLEMKTYSALTWCLTQEGSPNPCPFLSIAAPLLLIKDGVGDSTPWCTLAGRHMWHQNTFDQHLLSFGERWSESTGTSMLTVAGFHGWVRSSLT